MQLSDQGLSPDPRISFSARRLASTAPISPEGIHRCLHLHTSQRILGFASPEEFSRKEGKYWAHFLRTLKIGSIYDLQMLTSSLFGGPSSPCLGMLMTDDCLRPECKPEHVLYPQTVTGSVIPPAPKSWHGALFLVMNAWSYLILAYLY